MVSLALPRVYLPSCFPQGPGCGQHSPCCLDQPRNGQERYLQGAVLSPCNWARSQRPDPTGNAEAAWGPLGWQQAGQEKQTTPQGDGFHIQ